MSTHALPTGTITLLFTDIQRSTHLLQQLGSRYASVLSAYRDQPRTALQQWNGYEVDIQGDSFFAACGELEQTRHAHAQYYLHLAEEGEAQLFGAEQVPWLDRLEREYDNLRAALSWSVERTADGEAEHGSVRGTPGWSGHWRPAALGSSVLPSATGMSWSCSGRSPAYSAANLRDTSSASTGR